jgi:transcription antitermination factor NusG
MNPSQQGRYVEWMGEYCGDVPVYYPEYVRLRRPAKQREVIKVKEPVFPGYVFIGVVNGGGKSWFVPCPIRVWKVKFGGEVAEVRSSVIVKLRELELAGMLMVQNEDKRLNRWKVGMKVGVAMPGGVGVVPGVIWRLLNESRLEVDCRLGIIRVGVEAVK